MSVLYLEKVWCFVGIIGFSVYINDKWWYWVVVMVYIVKWGFGVGVNFWDGVVKGRFWGLVVLILVGKCKCFIV